MMPCPAGGCVLLTKTLIYEGNCLSLQLITILQLAVASAGDYGSVSVILTDTPWKGLRKGGGKLAQSHFVMKLLQAQPSPLFMQTHLKLKVRSLGWSLICHGFFLQFQEFCDNKETCYGHNGFIDLQRKIFFPLPCVMLQHVLWGCLDLCQFFIGSLMWKIFIGSQFLVPTLDIIPLIGRV